MKIKISLLPSLLLGLLFFQSCQSGTQNDGKNKAEKKIPEAEAEQLKKAQSFFAVLPDGASFDRPIAQLGKELYYETALSLNNEMSCNTCHQLDNYGVDNKPTSPSFDKKAHGDRNSPTVYNTYFHIAQFWDGRAADLAEQAEGPILNPVEMAIPDAPTAVERIKAKPDYAALFAEAFPNLAEPITFKNIALSIAEFEKTLATPSRWDAYLSGDYNALTEGEKQGMNTFINTGCIACHTGPGLGGQMYHKFGLVNSPYMAYTHSEKEDIGRKGVSEKDGDLHFFKVSSLRNVAKTGPYFHDGSVADLKEAIAIMAKTQLGRDLEEKEIEEIALFLEALTGEIPSHALKTETTFSSL